MYSGGKKRTDHVYIVPAYAIFILKRNARSREIVKTKVKKQNSHVELLIIEFGCSLKAIYISMANINTMYTNICLITFCTLLILNLNKI